MVIGSRCTTVVAGLATAMLAISSSLLCVTASASPTTGVGQCAEPKAGQRFPEMRPDSAGMDSKAVDDALDFGTSAGGVAIQIYRHGCLVGDRTPTKNLPIPLASATKGITSVVVGRAIKMGYFNLDDPLGKFFPSSDPEHAGLTIRQILNQTTGIRFSWPSDIAGLATDSLSQTLAAPVDYAPDTTFQYAQNVLALLPEIVETATGMEFQQFVQQEIMAPLGIARGNWIWLRDRSGNTIASGGLAMRPDDLGRIGQLMISEGKWEGAQLLDASYIQESRTGTSANPGYGFLTWLNSSETYKGVEVPRAATHEHSQFPGSPGDLYSFEGALGQFLTIVPSRDLVIVRMGVPTRVDLANPLALLTGSGNPDTKELYQRIFASVVDIPAERYVNPYVLDSPGLPVHNLDDLDNLVDPVNTMSILFGTDQYAATRCNVLLCNDRNIFEDTVRLGVDVAKQLGDAVVATNNGPR